MLVARTDQDAAKHKGLTYFLMDMEQDEIQVRPLRQITGEAEFNELFIEGARIPDENVVGGVGNGWKVALTTLMNERAGLAFFLQVRLRQLLDELIEEAAERGLLDDPVVADRLGELHVKAEVLRLTAYRGLTVLEKYGQPGPEGALTKWMWSETNQQLAQLAADLLGPEALHDGHPLELRAAARPRQLDRGRHHRDPQEHRRRARARPPADALGDDRDELRLHRRPARDQAHRARPADQALHLGEGARGGRGLARRRGAVAGAGRARAGPASRSPRSTAARGWASSSS